MAVKTKKILVPLDGSKNSIRGLDMAIHIARQSQGTVTALAVKTVPGIYALHPLGFLDFNSMTEIKKLLAEAKVRAAQKGIDLTGKAIAGDPGYDIARFANNPKNKINMVVIGARGRGSAKEIFLGSVSNYVLHKSKKPILIDSSGISKIFDIALDDSESLLLKKSSQRIRDQLNSVPT